MAICPYTLNFTEDIGEVKSNLEQTKRMILAKLEKLEQINREK
jgi:hypothetical protein